MIMRITTYVLQLVLSFLTTVSCTGHFENVALGKQCRMSTTHYNFPSLNGSVNGNTSGTLTPDNCIHTENRDSSPWWEVNLGRPYPVYNITVWARTGFEIRMKYCVITVDGTECYRFDDAPADRQANITCKNGVLNGTVIRVSKNNGLQDDHRTINICEFQVFSCSAAYWGNGCNNMCGHCADGDVCDKVTGQCSGCSAGWQKPLCVNECPDGTFGVHCTKNCSKGCDNVCNKQSGYCLCEPGWQGTSCDKECAPGSYGVNCSNNCSVNCNDTCSRDFGNCTCKQGYKPPTCSEAITASDQMTSTGTLVGAVVGAIVAVTLVVVVVIILIRRRRATSTPKNLMTERDVPERRNSYQVPPHDTTYQNVTDMRHPDSQDHHESEPTFQDKAIVAKQNKKDHSLQTAGDTLYANLGFKMNNAISGDDRKKPTPETRKNMAAVDTKRTAKAEDIETVDSELAEESSPDDCRQNLYYNDDVYMTSEGANLKMDTVQQYLLDKLRGDVIHMEFKALPAGLTRAHDSGSKEENYYKNRFNSILPYDDTRVVLRGASDPGSNDYINASYINGVLSPQAYIAAQGPKENTLNDFWKMVWQEQVTHIVMLTNIKEGKKNKCELYWPNANQKQRYGSVEVRGLREHERADYTLRAFDIKAGTEATRHVLQYHYTTWPDHDIPTTAALVDFWRTVHTSHRAQQGRSPLLVHCSAGVGRSGTFIALDILMDQLQKQPKIDVFEVVKSMRRDRCIMVQAQSQYRVLHEALLEAYTSQDCRLSLLALDSLFPQFIDPQQTNKRIDAEFKKLKAMKVLLHKPSHSEAKRKENIKKNRTVNILPDDSNLVHLTFPVACRNDYINAVYFPTVDKQEGFILTQLPLPETVVDLWRLVMGNDVSMVVFLGDTKDVKQKNDQYWPESEGEWMMFGPFTVELKSLASGSQHFKQYSLSLKCEGHPTTRTIDVLQYWGWKGQTAGDVQDLLQLVDIVLTDMTSATNKSSSVIVQCGDGAFKSGLFSVICDVLHRVKLDNVVDVFMAVRRMQIVRPECIETEVQYRYIYRAVQEYKCRTEVYCNSGI